VQHNLFSQCLFDAHSAEVNKESVVLVVRRRFFNRNRGLGASAFHVEEQAVGFLVLVSVGDQGLQGTILHLHVLGVEGQLHLGELVGVDAQRGGFHCEYSFFVLVFAFQLHFAGDLVRVDDFDAFLDAVGLLGHDEGTEVELILVFEVGALVHDFVTLIHHLDILESGLFLENHLEVLGDDAGDARLRHQLLIEAVEDVGGIHTADHDLQVFNRDQGVVAHLRHHDGRGLSRFD